MKKSLTFLFMFLMSVQAFPCTTMSYEDGSGSQWVAKSFDFSSGDGYLFINKKNVHKSSFVAAAGLPVSWDSKFGSVSFNQAAKDFPFGGMNENGVSMEIMWLATTEYPEINSPKNLINESQIIQYVLDTASSTKDAVEKIKELSIAPLMAPVHYMICDTTSECVTLEFLNKQMIFTSMNKGKERMLQNISYPETLNLVRTNGTSERNSADVMNFIFDNSLSRSEDEIVKKSFINLEQVKQNGWSKWQIVYNLNERKVWFRSIKERTTKFINLNSMELDCNVSPAAKVLSINSPLAGDISSELLSFTTELNDQMIEDFEGVPSILKKTIKNYLLENHKCL